MTNPIVSTETSIKNLSQESQDLLNELESIATKAADIIPRLYASLRNDGLAPKDARNMIQSRMEISDRTIRRSLPEEAKQVHRKLDKMSNLSSQSKLADVTPVTLPPPEQPIIEAEPTPQELEEIAAFNQQVRERVTQPRKHEEAFMPLPLADQLNKFLLARMIGMARSNGDNSIKFKINNEGELYVP